MKIINANVEFITPVEGAGRGNPSEVEGLEQMMEQM